MGRQIIECVPNFSVGRDRDVILSLASAISSFDGVRVLHVDPGEATNRTVITFIGEARQVVEAAFEAVRLSFELIDMRTHSGEHPRLGGVDVLPLIPIEGISLEECASLARTLAARIAEELLIPSYCYEAAAFRPERRNLAVCRRGEYEGLAARLTSADDAPDFGARAFDEVIARSGAINIGARNFLIAVNFNLNTRSGKVASEIAADVRQSGRASTGVAGSLKACKAIGWFIEEYGRAQVSMNLTDISVTPLHVAFEEVSRTARTYGVEVTGTELIGLIPRRCMVEAGRHFIGSEASEDEAIEAAVRQMRMDELGEFVTAERLL
ncbi:MAG: glutamate formimidoyltransferase [Rikenellaceae bacterium]